MANRDTDTISRQTVIDTIRKIILGFFSDEDGTMTNTEKTLLSVNKAICNELAKLPPSPSKPQWIPCSERLPDEHKSVLCCTYGGHAFYRIH